MKAVSAKHSTVQTKSNGPFFRKGSQTDTARSNSAEPAFFSGSTASHAPVQAKLTVGEPNDPYEKQADAVADKVVQRAAQPAPLTGRTDTGSIQRKAFFTSASPGTGIQRKCDPCIPEETKEQKKDEAPGSDKPIRKKPIFESNGEPPADDTILQRKCAACEKEEQVHKKSMPGEQALNAPAPQRKCPDCEKENQHGKQIAKKSMIAGTAAPAVQQKCAACEKEEQLQKKEAGSGPTEANKGIEEGLNATKGSGSPLPEQTRHQMESSIGADFSNVRIHDDSRAAQLSQDLNAQAFTHGNDIYFNSGKYDTSSTQGQHLLAHELTHTVQQSGGTTGLQQMVQKQGSGSTNAKTSIKKADKDEVKDAGNKQGYIELKNKQLIFHIAEIKTGKYKIPQSVIDAVVNGQQLKLPKEGTRETKQDTKWKSTVRAESKNRLEALANKKTQDAIDDGRYMRFDLLKSDKNFKGYVGTFTQIANESLVPGWAHNGVGKRYQIEHMVDWQLVGDANRCDIPANLILLEENKNREVGKEVTDAILGAIGKIVDNYKKQYTDVPVDAKEAKRNYDVYVDKINGAGDTLDAALWYASDDFTKANADKDPFKKSIASLKEEGIPKNHFLLTTSSKRAAYVIPYSAKGMKIGAFKVTVQKKGDDIEYIKLENLMSGKENMLKASKSLNETQVSVNNVATDKYTIDDKELVSEVSPVLKSLSVSGFSPIEIDDKDIQINGFDVSVKGKVVSTLSILQGVDISFSYENGDFNVQAIIPLDQIGKNIPKPFKVNYCNIEIGGGTSTPIYIAGGLGFSIEKFGEGEIFARLDKNGVAFEGKFNFEPKWFDPSEICVSYEKGEWTITGKIGIKKGSLKGVKNATICIGYQKGVFMASGDAELDVPGIDKVKLGASIGENGDMSFFADVQLKKMAGIKSGSVHLSVMSKGDGELKVSIKGEAEPDFPAVPELATKLSISWEDGIFDMRAKAAYNKGRFTGSLEVGVTNRLVDKDGKPADTADEKNNLYVFGFGSLTVELYKGIKGTVGIRVTPEKEVFIAGEIVANNLMPFGEGYNIDKELLKFPSISVPLIGIPGMSVSAFIEGGVHFKFNWQPLVLKELRVGFKETNINELDKIALDITGSVGSAAHAEVYLEIKAGIKAEVLIAELKGALGGQAGLGLDAEAGGALDATWDMNKGLRFKEIRAFLNVTPKAIFRLTGSVDVNLDLWITTINLYHHEWVLAEKQLDLGGITLKLDFPIKFNEEGNVETPDPDKMNLQKPDFSGDAGKKILDDAINGDAEKEMAEKKRQLKAEIHAHLRNHTWTEDDTPSKYREKLMDKYDKSPEMQEFISHTIDDELKAMEYEQFESEKNDIRNAQVPLQSKLMMTNFFTMFHRYVTPAEIEGFKGELVMLDELRKLKEAQAASAAAQPPEDNKSITSLPNPSLAPAPLDQGNANKNTGKTRQPDSVPAATGNDGEMDNEPGKKIQKKEIEEGEPGRLEGGKPLVSSPQNLTGAHTDPKPQLEPVVPVKGKDGDTIQREPSSELDDNYKKAFNDKDWKKAAEYLNGFSREDINTHLKDVPTGLKAAIYAGALENPLVGPKAQVADITRAAFLEMNFRNELAKQQWKQAAMFLNGFNDADIKRLLSGLQVEQKVSLRNAALEGGFPAAVKNVNEEADFQLFEKNRIAKLEDDYNTAVAKKDWKEAAKLLNAYNDEDIQLKLALLNITDPEAVKRVRAAADNMEENSRVGRFAATVVVGAVDPKKLLLTTVLVGDYWTMQFMKGMELSGVAAKFGEGWQHVKDNLSDTKSSAKFIGGIYLGFPKGIVVDVWENIKGIVQLAWDLVKLQVEANFEPEKLAGEITRIVQALPDLVLKLMNGEEIGYQAGLYLSRNLKSEFIDKSAFEEGMLIGEIVGRLCTEVALLFIGVEEVSAAAKALRATKLGLAVAEAMEGSKIAKALMEAKGAGKILKGTEDLVMDAEKMENALVKMARIEEKAPAITEDMMKLEQKVMVDRLSASGDLAKPLKEAGFDAEIKVGEHTYKRGAVDGSWCRFTTHSPTCNVHLPEAVEQAVDKKVPPTVRLAYSGQKKLAAISADTFEKARSYRQALGMTEEAMKKNVAVAKAVTEDNKVFFLEAANQGAGGAHSEEMITGQLTELNRQLLQQGGGKARVVELFSERVPCSNCRDVIRAFFGEIDVFYMAGSAEPDRWRVILERWQSIENKLAAAKK
jgi:hypothetical protein